MENENNFFFSIELEPGDWSSAAVGDYELWLVKLVR